MSRSCNPAAALGAALCVFLPICLSAGCGGGGGSSNPTPMATPTPTPAATPTPVQTSTVLMDTITPSDSTSIVFDSNGPHFAKYYALTGGSAAGGVISIKADAFDPQLFIYRKLASGTFESVGSAGVNNNAFFTQFTLPVSAGQEYLVIATSTLPQRSGTYTITFSKEFTGASVTSKPSASQFSN